MAEITKSDYLALHTMANNMICELASTVIAAAIEHVDEVDSHLLLEIARKYTDELKTLTHHIVGD